MDVSEHLSLSPEQTAILQKLVFFKYQPDAKDLITRQEYAALNDFLKGYAWQLQRHFGECPIIPGIEEETPAFQEGMALAIREVERRNKKAELATTLTTAI